MKHNRTGQKTNKIQNKTLRSCP